MLDLEIPHEEIPIIPVYYNLELIRNRGMSKLSIHHRDQTFGKSRVHIPQGIRMEITNGIYVINDRIYYPRDVKSRVFQFSPKYDLECYSVHDGDFTVKDFRWSETKKRSYEHRIPPKILRQSYKLAGRLFSSINKKKNKAKKYSDKDHYDRFSQTLEQILKNSPC